MTISISIPHLRELLRSAALADGIASPQTVRGLVTGIGQLLDELGAARAEIERLRLDNVELDGALQLSREAVEACVQGENLARAEVGTLRSLVLDVSDGKGRPGARAEPRRPGHPHRAYAAPAKAAHQGAESDAPKTETEKVPRLWLLLHGP